MQNYISNLNINELFEMSDGPSLNNDLFEERNSSDVGSRSQMDFTATVESATKQYIDKFESTKVINKRVIAKSIIQNIGNEGADVDDRTAGLRKQFQALIDYVQGHDFTSIWENATVTVYDSDDNTFKIKSGRGKNTIMVTAREGVPIIKYIVNNTERQLNRTEIIRQTVLNAIKMPFVWLLALGGKGSRYSEYTSVDDASEAADSIIRKTPDLSAETRKMLQILREDIYSGLDGETSTRISIFVEGVNRGESFKFKIGSGSQNLIINISEDKINYQFSTGRYWTRFCRSAAKIFSLAVERAVSFVGYFLQDRIENKH